jgi:hypothetical protein
MSDGKMRHAPPRAAETVESLRGLGYSTATALADVIDNSISAKATDIDLFFHWDADRSSIRILDNGCGMTDEALFLAMRLGAKNPLDHRHHDDLGRFGLGLKTASFSQCRRLTVASRRDDVVSCLRWDLDVLAKADDDGWYLLEGPEPGSETLLDAIAKAPHGTLVVWETLDRLITPGFRQQDFLDMIDRVEAHLSMVFHRFIEGPNADIQLTINGRRVKPWDPFLINHHATWSSPVERLESVGATVEVQCHVLPHKDRLSERDHQEAAGPEGWTSQQGFYVYRNRRLIVPGGWLGLGRGRSWTKEEAHRLARIRLDIPNTVDADWNLDVRKSTAKPPIQLRDRLTLLAEDARHRARRVFASRGAPASSGAASVVVQAWRAEHFAGGVRYRIEREHPAVKAAFDGAGDSEPHIDAMLKLLEETVPVQRIWLDTTEQTETPRTGFAGASAETVMGVLTPIYRNMVMRRGLSSADARRALVHMEPFNNYPSLVDALPDIVATPHRQ